MSPVLPLKVERKRDYVLKIEHIRSKGLLDLISIDIFIPISVKVRQVRSTLPYR